MSHLAALYRLIGMCYIDRTHRTIMISVDMKVVGGMTSYDASCVTTHLRALFIHGEGRMAAFGFPKTSWRWNARASYREPLRGLFSTT